MAKQKIVVGLSGGVDSSVAALLLQKEGYEVIGVTMRNWDGDGAEQIFEDAARVAQSLGIAHHILDLRDVFQREVKDYFTGEYLRGRTPNPCVVCNRKIKWAALLDWAGEQGAEAIATGHYARIGRLPNGRYTVFHSVTEAKDQTYALFNLTQDQLARTKMPVGAFPKEKIRQMAAEAGIPVADKKDSQEICFIPDHDYAAFIEREVRARQEGKAEEADKAQWKLPEEGNFVTADGRVLGRHKGIIHYTIGQRKGLNLSMGAPVFVSAIRPETNEVVIGGSGDIFQKELFCSGLNLMAAERLADPVEVTARIRYGHRGTRCVLEKVGEDLFRCTFAEPVRAITPGQAVVFYEEDHIFGGGFIR